MFVCLFLLERTFWSRSVCCSAVIYMRRWLKLGVVSGQRVKTCQNGSIIHSKCYLVLAARAPWLLSKAMCFRTQMIPWQLVSQDTGWVWWIRWKDKGTYPFVNCVDLKQCTSTQVCTNTSVCLVDLVDHPWQRKNPHIRSQPSSPHLLPLLMSHGVKQRTVVLYVIFWSRTDWSGQKTPSKQRKYLHSCIACIQEHDGTAPRWTRCAVCRSVSRLQQRLWGFWF